MAWTGYFEYDGNEVINVSRVEAYAKSAGMNWFRPLYENDALGYMLGDGLRYVSPFLDPAPWTDPDIPASFDFMGVYPLDVTGIEDSTRSAEVTENTGDGGVPSRMRNSSKTLVFSAIILATTDAGASYGIRWLKSVLVTGPCGSQGSATCPGADLCYLDSSPDMYLPDQISNKTFAVDDPSDPGTFVEAPEDCLDPYLRSFRKVVFNSGPTITGKRETSDDMAVWSVQFTATVGMPYEYGPEVPVLEGMLRSHSGEAEDEFEDESTDDSHRGIKNPYVDPRDDDDFHYDDEGYIHTEPDCAQAEYLPIYDPLSPSAIPPPAPPSVPLSNWEKPKNWRRRTIAIPARYVPEWGEVVPKITLHARSKEIRTVRMRLYADPFGEGVDDERSCDWCADLVVSYIPPNHTLVLDGSEQTVYAVSDGGQRRRADSLVFRTDGTPFDWPALSCGFGYVLAVDLPQTQTPPSIDLSLFARTA